MDKIDGAEVSIGMLSIMIQAPIGVITPTVLWSTSPQTPAEECPVVLFQAGDGYFTGVGEYLWSD